MDVILHDPTASSVQTQSWGQTRAIMALALHFLCLELLASFLPSYLYSLFFSDYSSCGVSPVDFRSRIVGGKNSKRGWWPWHVGIYNTRGRGNGLSKTIWSFPLSITETCFIGRSEVVRETKQNFVSSKQ